MNDLFELSDRQLLEEIHAMLSARKKTRAPKQVDYGPAFEQAWAAYPKRNGSNPKKAAFNAWNARTRGLYMSQDMINGVQRYAKWVKGTNIEGTSMVMQASRFFGPGEEFLNPWELPAPGTVPVKIPTELNALVAFAGKYSISARIGESARDFRERVRASI